MIADGKPADVGGNPDVITAYLGAARAGGPEPTRACRGAHARPREAAAGGRKVRAGYGGSIVLTDRSRRPRGRSRGAAGPQRRRQDDNAAGAQRHAAVSAGSIVFDGVASAARPYEINRLGISLVPEGGGCFRT